MRRWTYQLALFAGSGLILLVLMFSRPAPGSAGYLPCFLCHGSQFQGSDLAPSVADTRLTDDQILKQIKQPRGVMPAFPEFAIQGIVDKIRAMPTGQPTAALPDAERAEALAMIAEAASARATEFARLAERASSTPAAMAAAAEISQRVFEETGDLQPTSKTCANAQAFASSDNSYLAQYGVHAYHIIQHLSHLDQRNKG